MRRRSGFSPVQTRRSLSGGSRARPGKTPTAAREAVIQISRVVPSGLSYGPKLLLLISGNRISTETGWELTWSVCSVPMDAQSIIHPSYGSCVQKSAVLRPILDAQSTKQRFHVPSVRQSSAKFAYRGQWEKVAVCRRGRFTHRRMLKKAAVCRNGRSAHRRWLP